MPVSHCDTVHYKCDKCGAGMDIDLWCIIDIIERPDLVEYCRNGSIHSFHCPDGHPVMYGVPLLLHNGPRHTIIFSPGPEPSTRDQDQQKANFLIDHLRHALPPGTDTDYLNVFRFVPRPDLPRALNEERDGADKSEVGMTPEHLALMAELARPVRPEDIPRRIQKCEEALSRLDRQEQQGFWGFLQAKLGTAYEQNPGGDRTDNLERCIQARQAALTIYTREEFPQEWTNLQINLGSVYLQRLRGKPDENVAHARSAFEAALTVLNREQFPDQWNRLSQWLQLPAKTAEAQNAEAQNAYNVRSDVNHLAQEPSVGTREPVEQRKPVAAEKNAPDDDSSALSKIDRCFENGDMAGLVELSRLMLQIVPLKTHPQQWVMHQTQLGYGLLNSPQGDRTSNIEGAIQAFEAALTVVNRDTSPQEWALLQFSVGKAYDHRLSGNRMENLNRAIQAYNASIEVYTRESEPLQWAEVQSNLGLAYEQLRPIAVENQERAREAFEGVLTVERRETSPVLWATTLADLGSVYQKRLSDMRSENVERALQCYEAALEVFTYGAYPREWAVVQKNMGDIYRDRPLGDLAENREQAIRCYLAALSVFTPVDFPDEWSRTQYGLGTAYRQRSQGDPPGNLDCAIEAYRAALTVITRASDSVEWAGLHLDLGVAFSKHIIEDQPAEVQAGYAKQAINSYEAALTIYTPQTFPEEWAMTQDSLGGAYLRWGGDDPSENLERAIEAFEAALSIRPQEEFLREYKARQEDRSVVLKARQWVTSQLNLATAYDMRMQGKRADNVQRAVEAYRGALEICTPQFGTPMARALASSLARLLVEQQRWTEAYEAYGVALDAARREYTFALTETSKLHEIEQNADVYQKLVDLCLRLEPPRPLEAFLYVEEGRSRLLRDQLGSLPVPPARDVPPRLIQMEAELIVQMRSLQQQISTIPDPAARWPLIEKATTTHQQLNMLWDDFLHKHNARDYVALRRGENLEWDDLQRWLGAQDCHAALLEFYSQSDRVIAFIIRPGCHGPIAVPIALPARRLEDAAQRLVSEVHHFDPRFEERETWSRVVQPLVREVMPHLQGVELLYVIPHGALHALPLHAIEHDDKPLIEYFPIIYAPSAATLLRVTPDASVATLALSAADAASWLVTGNPTGDLPFAEEEAREVALRLGVRALPGHEATQAAVQRELARVLRAHLSTHAFFEADDPFASGIRLAGGDTLTAREVMSGPLNTRFIALSACETGMQKVAAGDELMGLARAFLYAGVPSLLLSLWAVNDPATKDLMVRFYDHLYDRSGHKVGSTSSALRAAMLETRAMLPQTYYWASFALFGSRI